MPRKTLMTTLKDRILEEIEDLHTAVERIVEDLKGASMDIEQVADELDDSINDAFDANLATDKPEPAMAALIETLQDWRSIINAAIASAPLNDAVQNLRGISTAIVDITHDYQAR